MQDRAKEYSLIKHRIALINIFLTPIVLFLFLILGIPTYAKGIVKPVSPNSYINLIVFTAIMGILYYIVMLPLEYYSSFSLEHRFSLSNQTFKDWLKREFKKGIISFIIAIPITMVLYAFLRHWPLTWWFWTALFWFFISIILAKFAPIVIVPLFYKYSHIKNPEIQKRISGLVAKAGFKVSGVYELNISKDTKKANAALLGLGRQKRIVLCDTLIKNFTDEEIESVMAHELGHHKMNHIWKLAITSGFFTFLAFFIANIFFIKLSNILGYETLHSYESLILIAFILSVVNIPLLPLQNAFSRRLERNADIFAFKLTGNIDAFISTMKRIGEQNLSDTNPAGFYEIMLYDHPPIARRIKIAESYK
jgi:STE24 endopeptidase